MTVLTYRFSLHRPWDNRERKRYLRIPAIFPFNTGPRKHMWGHCGPFQDIILALPVAYTQWTSKLAYSTGHCHCTALQIKRETYTLFLKLHCQTFFPGHRWFCETSVHSTFSTVRHLNLNLIGHLSFPEHSSSYLFRLPLPGSVAYSTSTSQTLWFCSQKFWLLTYELYFSTSSLTVLSLSLLLFKLVLVFPVVTEGSWYCLIPSPFRCGSWGCWHLPSFPVMLLHSFMSCKSPDALRLRSPSSNTFSPHRSCLLPNFQALFVGDFDIWITLSLYNACRYSQWFQKSMQISGIEWDWVQGNRSGYL